MASCSRDSFTDVDKGASGDAGFGFRRIFTRSRAVAMARVAVSGMGIFTCVGNQARVSAILVALVSGIQTL